MCYGSVKHIQPVPSPFNGPACSIPLTLMIYLLSIHNPFIFCSISVQSSCTFLSILNPFNTCLACVGFELVASL